MKKIGISWICACKIIFKVLTQFSWKSRHDNDYFIGFHYNHHITILLTISIFYILVVGHCVYHLCIFIVKHYGAALPSVNLLYR